MLCSRCHRNVHQGFLRIFGNANGKLVFVDLKGRELNHPHPIEVAWWLDFWIGWFGGPENSRQFRLAGIGEPWGTSGLCGDAPPAQSTTAA